MRFRGRPAPQSGEHQTKNSRRVDFSPPKTPVGPHFRSDMGLAVSESCPVSGPIGPAGRVQETASIWRTDCISPDREVTLVGSKIVLTARHGNGWDTHVVQTAEGKFAAWAAPRGIRGMSEYVDLDETAAKQAALSSLERRTGHTQCTTECSPWEPAEPRKAARHR